ncbi:MAG: hypothetical protein OEV28_12210 [Nitrospirota bacterium]|nr:hypothetical protein [Nitrospirota bacterium]
MKEPDYENAVAITRDIHWVGFYDHDARLHCNPYLLIDEKDVILFDPGSIPHFPIVMRKIIDLVNPSDITFVVAHHQDPDVCGNLAILEDIIERPDLRILAHSNSVWFIRHYDLKSSVIAVDDIDYRLRLQSGRVLEFLFTPHLHSPGAIATYDRKTRSLFTSDIFGAVSRDWSLFAGDDFLEPMKEWHQHIMPNNHLLRGFIERIEEIEIERILPQHGSVLEGANIRKAMEFLKELPCGYDLIGK